MIQLAPLLPGCSIRNRYKCQISTKASQSGTNLFLRLRFQHIFQNLTTRILRDRIYKLDPTVQIFISRQTRCRVFSNFLHRQRNSPSSDDVGAWQLRLLNRMLDTDHGGVDDIWVVEENAFDFSRSNLEAADFDKFLKWGRLSSLISWRIDARFVRVNRGRVPFFDPQYATTSCSRHSMQCLQCENTRPHPNPSD